MERKDFIRNGVLLAIGSILLPKLLFSKQNSLEIIEIGEPVLQLRHGIYEPKKQEISRTIFYQDGLNGENSEDRISSIQIGKDYNQLLILKNGKPANRVNNEILVLHNPKGIFKNPFKKSLIFSESKNFRCFDYKIKSHEAVVSSEKMLNLESDDTIVVYKIDN